VRPERRDPQARAARLAFGFLIQLGGNAKRLSPRKPFAEHAPNWPETARRRSLRSCDAGSKIYRMPVISGNAISAAIQSATKGAVAPIRVRHSLILSILVRIVAYATVAGERHRAQGKPAPHRRFIPERALSFCEKDHGRARARVGNVGALSRKHWFRRGEIPVRLEIRCRSIGRELQADFYLGIVRGETGTTTDRILPTNI
jgi:hypothetical protein